MEEPINPETGLTYTTELPALNFAEYGRNVQRMVDFALTIQDKAERSRCARTIIEAMSLLNPSGKETADFKQKLWDQLHIMSGFKLDVECPYPVPEASVLESKPERISYPGEGPRFKHYGEILENMISSASGIENQEEKNAAVLTIANIMKRFYVVWNKDHVPDEVIWEHLRVLSKGKLQPDDQTKLNQVNDLPRPNFGQNGNGKRKKGRNQQRRKF